MPTDEQWQKLIRAVKQLQGKAKDHDQAIEDLWTKVNADFDAEVSMVDEANEQAEKNHRAIRRLLARIEELESRDNT